jgi:hypothetical protein
MLVHTRGHVRVRLHLHNDIALKQLPTDGVVQRTSSSDVSAWVLNQTSSSAFGTLVFNRRTPLIVGVDDEGLLIGWFNGQGYHTVAEAS